MTDNNDAKSRLPLNRLEIREEQKTDLSAPVAGERFSDDEMYVIRHEFARRFQEAFRGMKQRDIARQLLSTDKTIEPYLKGDRLPAPDMILMIHRASGVSLDWLLMGKGEKFIHKEIKNGFSAEEIAEIEELAAKSGRSFDEELRSLVNVGISALRSYRS